MNYLVLIVYMGVVVILGAGSTALCLFVRDYLLERKLKKNIPNHVEMHDGDYLDKHPDEKLLYEQNKGGEKK